MTPNQKSVLRILIIGALISVGLGFITPMLGLVFFTLVAGGLWSKWKK